MINNIIIHNLHYLKDIKTKELKIGDIFSFGNIEYCHLYLNNNLYFHSKLKTLKTFTESQLKQQVKIYYGNISISTVITQNKKISANNCPCCIKNSCCKKSIII